MKLTVVLDGNLTVYFLIIENESRVPFLSTRFIRSVDCSATYLAI
jgi:hypothetical protein